MEANGGPETAKAGISQGTGGKASLIGKSTSY
jgi:hypothetical protein